jgi:transposase
MGAQHQNDWERSRMASFAVIITIMVLELKPPDNPSFAELLPLWPTGVSYAVSYLFIAIVWVNHHHLLQFADHATPSRLLKNRLDFSYKERVFEKKEPKKQEEFWIETRRLPRLSAGRFFQGVDEVLAEIGFGEQVHQLCRPAYSQRSDGRPGIDPVVYFKMLTVGFFENLPSERAIAARCEDSLAVRAFLGYSLEEATPDHSSLSVIRRRLSAETYQAVFELILKALKNCGLLKGRYVGIDSSVIEANASLKSLVVRNTEEAYWDYVRKLAQEAGIDAKDDRAVRQFDRKRPNKKLSNKQFKNRHDPEAKISRQKGKTDLVDRARK